MKWFKGTAVALLVLALIGCGGANNRGTPNRKATPTLSASASPSFDPGKESIDGPSLPVGRVGNGVWMVNSEIIPGWYSIDVPKGQSCYWERLRVTDGTADDILENGQADGPAHIRVHILKSDNAVRSDGCPEWVLIGH